MAKQKKTSKVKAPVATSGAGTPPPPSPTATPPPPASPGLLRMVTEGAYPPRVSMARLKASMKRDLLTEPGLIAAGAYQLSFHYGLRLLYQDFVMPLKTLYSNHLNRMIALNDLVQDHDFAIAELAPCQQVIKVRAELRHDPDLLRAYPREMAEYRDIHPGPAPQTPIQRYWRYVKAAHRRAGQANLLGVPLRRPALSIGLRPHNSRVTTNVTRLAFADVYRRFGP